MSVPSPSHHSCRGVTLIELSVAMAIIAVLFGAVVMGVGAITGVKAKAAAGELGGTIRSLYDTAALSGKTCRLVFQLSGERDDNPSRYWAECAAGGITTRRNRDEALREDSHQAEEAKKARGREPARSWDSSGGGEPTLQELLSREKERVDTAARYAQYTSPEVSPRELPAGVRLSVWTRHQREAVKSGLAYLYFFPQGFTEKAQIAVRQGDNVWTLTVAPLTGKTAVVPEELEVPRS